MSRKSYHVTPSGNGWSVRRAGAHTGKSSHALAEQVRTLPYIGHIGFR